MKDICEKSSLRFFQSNKCRSQEDSNHIPPFVSKEKNLCGRNNMTEKKHPTLGADFTMKYNHLFVWEVLNPWVCVSRRLAVFLYFTERKIPIESMSQDTF